MHPSGYAPDRAAHPHRKATPTLVTEHLPNIAAGVLAEEVASGVGGAWNYDQAGGRGGVIISDEIVQEDDDTMQTIVGRESPLSDDDIIQSSAPHSDDAIFQRSARSHTRGESPLSDDVIFQSSARSHAHRESSSDDADIESSAPHVRVHAGGVAGDPPSLSGGVAQEAIDVLGQTYSSDESEDSESEESEGRGVAPKRGVLGSRFTRGGRGPGDVGGRRHVAKIPPPKSNKVSACIDIAETANCLCSLLPCC